MAQTTVSVRMDNDLKKEFGMSFSILLPFSSEKKIYSDNVWEEIEKILKL